MSRVEVANVRIFESGTVTERIMAILTDLILSAQGLEPRVLRAVNLDRLKACPCGRLFIARPTTKAHCSVACGNVERQRRKRAKGMNGTYIMSITAIREQSGAFVHGAPVAVAIPLTITR